MQLGVNIKKHIADSFATNSIANPTMAFVALIVDAASRYAHVHVPAQTWKEVIDILEDQGCEVVEDQTEDYDSDDLANKDSLNKAGVMTIDQLLNESDYIPN